MKNSTDHNVFKPYIDRKGIKREFYVLVDPIRIEFVKRPKKSSLISIYRTKTFRRYDFCSLQNCWKEAQCGSVVLFKENKSEWITVLCKEHSEKRISGKIKFATLKEDVLLVPYVTAMNKSELQTQ